MGYAISVPRSTPLLLAHLALQWCEAAISHTTHCQVRDPADLLGGIGIDEAARSVSECATGRLPIRQHRH
ncbi:hypothetical protein CALCODRAFT_494221 [Calocera cornea HHB12733]|uniref:Uncharacterized protein n=1 Tax=Calocera cornea HHB12733 TaxID=1353952 RepID=A0A165H8E1_9BASI|nr:hypothetical protein CALCODRAFT_494221 [Calocera cornea HHB12733]